MKRLGIFCFYDKEGEVDEYVYILLKRFDDILDKLVIVVNGIMEQDAIRYFEKEGHIVFVRENLGYDSGAYKDVFVSYMKGEIWSNWDEIVLFNGTFYGPFMPWNETFKLVEKGFPDFWGLTRWLGQGDIQSYINSFFLVIGNKILRDKCFMEYWEKLEYPMNRYEAKQFEMSFSNFFSEQGFTYTTWQDVALGNEQLELKQKGNLYRKFSDRLIRKYKCPILKQKAMSVVYFKEMQNSLDYIEKNTEYDVEIIKRHIAKLDKKGRLWPFGFSKLEEFVHEHKNIYVFGHGEFGKGLQGYFEFKGWKIEAFVVTIPNGKDEIAFENLELGQHDGLIVALNIDALSQVENLIRNKIDERQLLCPKLP